MEEGRACIICLGSENIEHYDGYYPICRDCKQDHIKCVVCGTAQDLVGLGDDSYMCMDCCYKESGSQPKQEHYDAHYASYGDSLQPIEIMQRTMSNEAFMGFLIGNIIKYSMRNGRKDATDKEVAKLRRYFSWAVQVSNGESIDPRK